MFRYRFDEAPDRGVLAHWLLLAFNAGCINAGGFLATGRFVSHVTGFATLFGVERQQFGLRAALPILSVPLFFLLGVTVAGLMTDRRVRLRRAPRYDAVMALCAACLLLAAVTGGSEYFGAFGESFHIKHTYLLLALLCLASGLQNGAITSSSGSSVRTTHLTGLTTDLGLGLARLMTFQSGERLRDELLANGLRLGTILAFIAGSAVGAALFSSLHFLGFLLPASVAGYAAWHGYRLRRAAPEGDALPEALPGFLAPVGN